MGKEIKKCVIISGAPESDLSYYKDYINDCFIICADSGYLKCKKIGVKPDLIIGDFDSSYPPNEDCEIITLQVRKNDSDTFHCVKVAAERGYRDITVLGGIGSRVDHTYSNILSLNYCLNNGISAKLVNNNNMVIITDKPVKFSKDKYEFFSMFAVFDRVENLSISGAQYDLSEYTLEPDDQLTQSNGFKDQTVNISFTKGKLILIFSND